MLPAPSEVEGSPIGIMPFDPAAAADAWLTLSDAPSPSCFMRLPSPRARRTAFIAINATVRNAILRFSFPPHRSVDEAHPLRAGHHGGRTHDLDAGPEPASTTTAGVEPNTAADGRSVRQQRQSRRHDFSTAC